MGKENFQKPNDISSQGQGRETAAATCNSCHSWPLLPKEVALAGNLDAICLHYPSQKIVSPSLLKTLFGEGSSIITKASFCVWYVRSFHVYKKKYSPFKIEHLIFLVENETLLGSENYSRYACNTQLLLDLSKKASRRVLAFISHIHM